jgi:hypothetical protein
MCADGRGGLYQPVATSRWARIAVFLFVCTVHLGVLSVFLPRHPTGGIALKQESDVMLVDIHSPVASMGAKAPSPLSEAPTTIDLGSQWSEPSPRGQGGMPAAQRPPQTSSVRRKDRATIAPPARRSADEPADGSVPSNYRWRPTDSAIDGRARAPGVPVIKLSPKACDSRSALAREIEKAARPPCSQAYATGGLLGLPFLLADTIKDSGCKW